jgi:plasmid maintenance system antidote protein VapI
MNPRAYWNFYVVTHGGASVVARRLGIPYSTIAGVCNGSRGIGPRLAKRIHEAEPLLDPSQLVWVKAEKQYAKRAA